MKARAKAKTTPRARRRVRASGPDPKRVEEEARRRAVAAVMAREVLSIGRLFTEAEEIYQRMVRPEVYRRTVAYLESLPPKVDRVGYFRAFAVAEMRGLAVESTSAHWCSRRDEALRNLEAAIRQLKSVVRDVDLFPGHDAVAYWVGGLEREFRRLTQPWDDFSGRRHLMLMTPEDYGRHTRGRRVSRARFAKGILRVAGVPARKIAGALRAAGLSEPSPRRAQQ